MWNSFFFSSRFLENVAQHYHELNLPPSFLSVLLAGHVSKTVCILMWNTDSVWKNTICAKDILPPSIKILPRYYVIEVLNIKRCTVNRTFICECVQAFRLSSSVKRWINCWQVSINVATPQPTCLKAFLVTCK